MLLAGEVPFFFGGGTVGRTNCIVPFSPFKIIISIGAPSHINCFEIRLLEIVEWEIFPNNFTCGLQQGPLHLTCYSEEEASLILL